MHLLITKYKINCINNIFVVYTNYDINLDFVTQLTKDAVI